MRGADPAARPGRPRSPIPGSWSWSGSPGPDPVDRRGLFLMGGDMIQVDRLSRRFGSFPAVDRVSFEIGQGEIVGFLGPNGAGKTTTMRILTSYLPATSGIAKVAGFDVMLESTEVRKHIGYLPENVPLYPEMRVEEYLHFRA